MARRAVELLEQEQQVLRREQRRLAELVVGSGQDWRARAARAEAANVRALVGGGRDELRRAECTVRPATVTLEWTTAAGATCPRVAAVDLPPPPALAGAPAVLEAAAACRMALDAAARLAAATAALGRVERELVVTGRRLRAIRRRWLPELEAQLAQLELRLDDGEREEVTRLRWAAPATGHQE